jgi:hypothetical protein
MRLLLTLFFSVVALYCYADEKSNTILVTNAPVIKIDETHRMNNRPAGVPGDTYHIPVNSTVVIDATGYKFDVLVGFEGKPLNSIQIVQDKTHQFTLTWEAGKTRYELSKDTLKPVSGSQPFEGFKVGDKIVLGIGFVYEVRQFAVVWAGMVEVR